MTSACGIIPPKSSILTEQGGIAQGRDDMDWVTSREKSENWGGTVKMTCLTLRDKDFMFLLIVNPKQDNHFWSFQEYSYKS